MKHSIILFFALLLIAPSAYSQHLAKVIPVDIPLNSSKESAINILLNNNYELAGTGDNILCYKQKDNGQRVRLWMKNDQVSVVEWLLQNEFEIDYVSRELDNVYGIKPYARTVEDLGRRGVNKLWYNESYYYWKTYTIVLGFEVLRYGSRILIMSNSDAKNWIEKKGGNLLEK